ncbi:unnamed protein product, partial [Amoebophrya sp. A25]|eukprot:GSA25T00013233001.1
MVLRIGKDQDPANRRSLVPTFIGRESRSPSAGPLTDAKQGKNGKE